MAPLIESLKHAQQVLGNTKDRVTNSASGLWSEGSRLLAPAVAAWHARHDPAEQEAAPYRSSVLSLGVRCQVKAPSGKLPLPKSWAGDPEP